MVKIIFQLWNWLVFGRKDSNPKQAYRSLSQIGEYFKSGFSEIDARFESLAGEERVNLLADMLRGEHHLPFLTVI